MLWILSSKEPFMYDAAEAFVIRAPSPRTARKLAAENHGDEEPAIWLDVSRSTCKLLKEDGESEVILRDFNSSG